MIALYVNMGIIVCLVTLTVQKNILTLYMKNIETSNQQEQLKTIMNEQPDGIAIIKRPAPSKPENSD